MGQPMARAIGAALIAVPNAIARARKAIWNPMPVSTAM
jgi:hypothetical protein